MTFHRKAEAAHLAPMVVDGVQLRRNQLVDLRRIARERHLKREQRILKRPERRGVFLGRVSNRFLPSLHAARSHRAQRASLKGSLQPPLQRQRAAACQGAQEARGPPTGSTAARRA